MKKELDYFTIDGEFGGDQDWFTNIVMHVGGCAAATACDSCIYLAKEWKMKELYPFDVEALNKKEYVAFSQRMKPYLKPRMQGVCRLWMFTEGFGAYLAGIAQEGRPSIRMEEFEGTHSWEDAREFLREKLDRGLPVPYLMLRHKNAEKFKDFIWHWFLIVGYEERENLSKKEFYIKAATYGEATWFNLKELWETGQEERGGMIGYEIFSAETGSAEI